MAVSRIGSGTGTTSATLPTHQAGDLIIVAAYRDGSNTAPTLPAGFINIVNAGASTNSIRVGYKIATSSSETSGTWTNATSTIVVVYRGATIGTASTTNTGASTTLTYGALTLNRTDNTSWVVGFGGHRSANVAIETAPSGMTNITSVSDATDEMAVHDSNATVTSRTSSTAAVGGTSSGWATAVVEILEKRALTLTCDQQSYTLSGQSVTLTYNPPPSIFGYDTIGAVTLSGITDSTTLGSRFTCGITGSVTAIKVYTNINASGTATLRVAIFSNTGSDTIGTLIASSSPVNVTNTSPQWIDVPISASVNASTDYWLFAWGDASGFSSDFSYYADANSDPNSIVTSFGNSYPTWSTVGDGVDENYDLGNMSIYANVTASGGAYSLTCSGGSFTLSGQAVTLRANRTLALTQVSFTLSGQSVILVYAKRLSMAQASFTLSGQDLKLRRAEILPINQGTFTLSGQSVNLKRALNFVLNGASYTLTSQSANLNKSLRLSLVKGDFSLSGQVLTLQKSSSLTIGEGVFSVSGQSVGLTKQSKISATQQSYTLSGQAMTFVYDQLGAYTLVCHEGLFTLSGQNVGLVYDPANQYTLTCTQGAYTLSGQALGIYKRNHIDLNQSVFSLNGQSINLLRSNRLNNSTGYFTLNGQDVTLTANKFKRRYFITS